MGTPISYTFSPQLHSLTSSIDQYHTQILTTPLAPRNEIALRTRATHHRILSVLSHAHIPMTEPELSTLLMHPPKRPHPIDKEALLYRQALSYIRDEWTGRIDYFSLLDIEMLMHLSLPLSYSRISHIMHDATPKLSKLIAYCTASNDHPILLSGITHAYMTQSPLHNISKGRISFLLMSLILARSGYDARGMLTLESTLTNDHKAYTHALTSISSYGQMTIWLEYFATCILEAHTSLKEHIRSIGTHPEKISTTHLNTRQKQILVLLDTYGTKITNRDVQKRFGISQITASRDLARLLSAGYIASHGNGRSISYSIA